ncbi:DNA-binding protein [Methylobacterium terrae]|uniref:DNA-binding protein n=1 Tax=Methylobacterium terrae TaxID=2202827 RepID=A0A2U8WPN7_9HYPH|nr:DNA-binding protein [Methylobacterium terrae]AWN47162.1 DNA-binding protein [Methylobacterium terrae]
MTTTAEPDDDLLYGVPAIAGAFGWKVRQVHHLKDAHGLPTFKIGRTVCARRTEVRRWITAQAAAGREAGAARA